MFSEREFHLWLERALSAGGAGALPMGDDVAAIRVGRAMLLLTTDALSEGSHFLPSADPRAVGRAAVAASLSDIASKGGRPLAVLIDLLLPPDTPPQWARKVVEGAEACAAKNGCHVVGGDTKPGRGRTVVGTVVGLAGPGRLPSRASARPGDLLLVTGTVGRGGRAALPLIQGRLPDARERRALLDLRPRLREGRALAPHARAMIDTSDGLADGARRLAHASRVRVVLDIKRLPLDPGLARLHPASQRLEVAMYGGDYELLASVAPDRVAQAVRSVRAVGGRLTPVGWVEPGRGAYLTDAGRRNPLPKTGWDPFRPPISVVRRAGMAHSPR
jgi:thiamine-monophosphate kinase